MKLQRKIAFIGAGSTVFAREVLGDCMAAEALEGFEISLHDIDPQRLAESQALLTTIARNLGFTGPLTATLDRRESLRGARYVVNAVQIGGYRPSTVIDFEIPKKYGLRQTIGDTLGIGGIFRGLRTIPFLMGLARDMEELCPGAWLMNYSNPMSILTGALVRYTDVPSVGLCHSVQVCARELLEPLGMDTENLQWKVAGINHQSWLLELTRDGVDLYPEAKRRAFARTESHDDLVRYELMKRFGYYPTESSEHGAEYVPWFLKAGRPELVKQYAIPLDEYPRRCEEQIAEWAADSAQLLSDSSLGHVRGEEYASYLMEAMETGVPYLFGGNVLNTGLITNLPSEACVEVPCLADRSGIRPLHVGNLPPQCAALNRTMIGPQLMTIEAAVTGKREAVYQAALLDPHTAAQLSIDETVALCDELIAAHREYLPALH